MADPAETSLAVLLRRYRFIVLMVSLGALILVAPFLHSIDVRAKAGLPEIGLGLLFLFMMISAADAASRGRLSRIVAWSLVTPLAIIWIVDLMTGADATAVAAIRHTLGIVFIAFVVFLIIGHLFSSRTVTADTIAASLCIYFLMAVMWAEIYSIMEILNPDSFVIAGAVTPNATLELGSAGTATALYYSLVTLTTLGYGDVVPSSAPARMFAAMEAATGQIYLAVLVARLVGMHIVHSAQGDGADNKHG